MMFFRKKDRDDDQTFEDPATRYGRMLKHKHAGDGKGGAKPSLLARIFGMGHDRDFVYHED